MHIPSVATLAVALAAIAAPARGDTYKYCLNLQTVSFTNVPSVEIEYELLAGNAQLRIEATPAGDTKQMLDTRLVDPTLATVSRLDDDSLCWTVSLPAGGGDLPALTLAVSVTTDTRTVLETGPMQMPVCTTDDSSVQTVPGSAPLNNHEIVTVTLTAGIKSTRIVTPSPTAPPVPTPATTLASVSTSTAASGGASSSGTADEASASASSAGSTEEPAGTTAAPAGKESSAEEPAKEKKPAKTTKAAKKEKAKPSKKESASAAEPDKAPATTEKPKKPKDQKTKDQKSKDEKPEDQKPKDQKPKPKDQKSQKEKTPAEEKAAESTTAPAAADAAHVDDDAVHLAVIEPEPAASHGSGSLMIAAATVAGVMGGCILVAVLLWSYRAYQHRGYESLDKMAKRRRKRISLRDRQPLTADEETPVVTYTTQT